ncbi:MAG TPA: GxxExxY protein [Dehalococcoidia bacterium]|nr:GxxExxY protein [Dehalococcoidia bacterium]
MPEKVFADKELPPELNALTQRIIGACIEVHRALGPGLLESAYEACLCRELSLVSLPFRRQVPLPVEYKGARLDAGYQLDLVVDEIVIVELKAVDGLLPVHDAQIITYLKLTGLPAGLLINFNVPALIRGVRRFANTTGKNSASSAPLR